jgi:IS605 OrfB family transposase
MLEDAAVKICDLAKARDKPLVTELLDFTKKKNNIQEEQGAKYARMLSSLSYAKIIAAVQSRAVKIGVATKQVNPAYTSLIGRINYTTRYGYTTHQGAAVAIARRGFAKYVKSSKKFIGLRERPLHQLDNEGRKIIVAPTGRGVTVTCAYPELIKHEHNWAHLRRVMLKLKPVLAAQRLTKDPSTMTVPV